MVKPTFIPLAPTTPPHTPRYDKSYSDGEFEVPETPRGKYHAPLTVSLATPTLTPPGDDLSVRKRMDRPETPLDFNIAFDDADDPRPSSDLGHGSDDERDFKNISFPIPPIRSARGSIDLLLPPTKNISGRVVSGIEARPEVDPSIKGIPQGWEDDATIPLLLTPPPHPPHHPLRNSIFYGSSPMKDDPDAMLPPPRPHHSRLASFRETKAKFSTLSAAMKEKARGYDRPQNAKGGRPADLDPHRLASLSPHAGTDPPKPQGRARAHHARSPSLRIAPPPLGPRSLPGYRHQVAMRGGSEPSLVVTEEYSEPPTASLDYGASTESSVHGLFTPPAAGPSRGAYESSLTSTQSSAPSLSNREHVLGLRGASAYNPLTAPSKVFLPPNKADVLPWTNNNPYTAWEVPEAEILDDAVPAESRESLATRSSHKREGIWRIIEGNGGRGRSIDSPTKKVFNDPTGRERVYKVGWEREVLDLESRLHETMFDVAGESHSFVSYPEDEHPKAVLDIGTGSGLWPISQALVWLETTFVGLDVVPCQTDLRKLVKAEEIARSSSGGSAIGGGIWQGIERRITWDQADFLETLPYDSGVFDLVHIRFVGLGVPEDKWSDLLEEAHRVLRPGGYIELVEMSLRIPGNPHPSLRNSFASLLLADMIQPRPSLPIQFALPLIPGLKGVLEKGSAAIPIFEKTWGPEVTAPGALRDAAMVWAKSALEYKGTGMKQRRENGTLERVKRELRWANAKKWPFRDSDDEAHGEKISDGEAVTVWAWVGIKK